VVEQPELLAARVVVAEHVRLRDVQLRGDEVGGRRDEAQLDPGVARVPRLFSLGVVDPRFEVFARCGGIDDLHRDGPLEAEPAQLLDGGAHLPHHALGLRRR
jgi:hypothetical protein